MPLPQEYDPKKEISGITEKALRSKGFVLFAGMLSEEKDNDGNFKINFIFTRHKFPYEDLPKAAHAFRDHCYKDALSMFNEQK